MKKVASFYFDTPRSGIQFHSVEVIDPQPQQVSDRHTDRVLRVP